MIGYIPFTPDYETNSWFKVPKEQIYIGPSSLFEEKAFGFYKDPIVCLRKKPTYIFQVECRGRITEGTTPMSRCEIIKLLKSYSLEEFKTEFAKSHPSSSSSSNKRKAVSISEERTVSSGKVSFDSSGHVQRRKIEEDDDSCPPKGTKSIKRESTQDSCAEEQSRDYSNGDITYFAKFIDESTVHKKDPFMDIFSFLDKTLHYDRGIWYSGAGQPVTTEEDKPIVGVCGSKHWFLDGKRHRVGGPAIECNGKQLVWLINGVLHREDGPAIIYGDESQFWYRNGFLDREDGPAVEFKTGYKQWYHQGVLGRIDEPNGTKRWYVNDRLREGLEPAIECIDGTKKWVLNECVVRIEYSNGDKYYYHSDMLHREDGPAVELATGEKEWWFHGRKHRIGGPAIENSSGKYWYRNGLLDREDGPAIELVGGNKEWWVHGKRHRDNGPAILYPRQSMEFYKHGEKIDVSELLLAEQKKEYFSKSIIPLLFRVFFLSTIIQLQVHHRLYVDYHVDTTTFVH